MKNTHTALSQARAQALHPSLSSTTCQPSLLPQPWRCLAQLSRKAGAHCLEIAIVWCKRHARETGDSIRPK